MRRSEEPLEKVTIRLYVGDFARLHVLKPDMPPNLLIRELIRGYIQRVEEAANQLPREAIKVNLGLGQ